MPTYDPVRWMTELELEFALLAYFTMPGWALFEDAKC